MPSKFWVYSFGSQKHPYQRASWLFGIMRGVYTQSLSSLTLMLMVLSGSVITFQCPYLAQQSLTLGAYHMEEMQRDLQ